MNPVTLTFRWMQMKDLERVVEIDRLSFSLPWPASSFRYELEENEAARCWVLDLLETNGQWVVVGMAVVWVVLDEAHIATIAIHPDYRRLGLGKRLLNALLQDAIRQGLRIATLEVRLGNLAAQQLYQQFGFEVVGKRPRYYHDTNEDALIMTVRLSEARLLPLSG
jgi:ribosomal-protein-alanine N-acetyltransferase